MARRTGARVACGLLVAGTAVAGCEQVLGLDGLRGGSEDGGTERASTLGSSSQSRSGSGSKQDAGRSHASESESISGARSESNSSRSSESASGSSSHTGSGSGSSSSSESGAELAVIVTSPPNGANILVANPTEVELTASAAPTMGAAITQVSFFVNGALVANFTGPPYDVPAQSFPGAGTYQITAEAKDSSGAMVTSAPVTLVVTAMPTTVFMGEQTLGTDTDYTGNGIGEGEGNAAVATATGNAGTLYVYVDAQTTAQAAVAGVYSTSGPGMSPNALLATGTLAAPVSDTWNVITLPSFGVVTGDTYLLAFLSPVVGNVGTFWYRRASGTMCLDYATTSQTLSAFPSTWSGGNFGEQPCISAFVGP